MNRSKIGLASFTTSVLLILLSIYEWLCQPVIAGFNPVFWIYSLCLYVVSRMWKCKRQQLNKDTRWWWEIMWFSDTVRGIMSDSHRLIYQSISSQTTHSAHSYCILCIFDQLNISLKVCSVKQELWIRIYVNRCLNASKHILSTL